jgi:hypothetical protein
MQLAQPQEPQEVLVDLVLVVAGGVLEAEELLENQKESGEGNLENT